MFAIFDFCLPMFSCIVGRVELDWERLSDAVLERRTSMDWTQQEVWDRGGPSDTLQTDIEAKRWKPTRSVRGTLTKIDIGMEWAPGSALEILKGGSPTIAGSMPPDPQDLAAVKVSAMCLADELFLLWETWRDIALELVHTGGPMGRRARRGLLITGDVVLDIAALAGASQDATELSEDILDTINNLIKDHQIVTREEDPNDLEAAAQPDASPTGDKNKEDLGGPEELEGRDGRSLGFGGSDADDSAVDGTEEGEEGHDLPGA